MARISGVDLPKNKRGEIGLTYIYGLGRSTARRILKEAGVSFDKKVQDWDDADLTKIRNIITNKFKVEGALRSETQLNIKRLIDIGTFRGIRHITAWDADASLSNPAYPVPPGLLGDRSRVPQMLAEYELQNTI